MKTEILDAVESKDLKENIPYFVIARRGRGINETFTVRRMVGSEGVERIFPLHSPNVVDVKAIRSGKTRRAKLYFLRQRSGKAVKLAHKHSSHTVAR